MGDTLYQALIFNLAQTGICHAGWESDVRNGLFILPDIHQLSAHAAAPAPSKNANAEERASLQN